MSKTPPRPPNTLTAAQVIAIATELEAPPRLTMPECKEWVRRKPRTLDEYANYSDADRLAFEAVFLKVSRFIDWAEASGEVGRRLYPDAAAKLSALLQIRLDESNTDAIFKTAWDQLQLGVSPGIPMRAMVSAIHNRSTLAPDATGAMSHKTVNKARRDGTGETVATVTFRRQESTLERRTVDEFLRFVRDAPETTVDVLLICMSRWRENRDAGGGAWITADQVLRCRGIKPKQKSGCAAGWRPKDLSEVAEAITLLNAAWLSVENTVSYVNDKTKRRRKQDVHNSRFLAVLDHKARTIDGQLVDVGWRYSFGEWVQFYPFDHYFAVINRALVRYHAFRMRWERRLGLYAGLHLSAAANRTIERDIRSVFDEAGLTPDINSRYPERTVKRLRGALNRLTSDGHFRSWTINGQRDGALDKYLVSHLPARSWWPAFEQMKLTIEGQPPNGPLFETVEEHVALAL